MTTINQITPIPISDLEDATSLTGNEALPIVQNNQTVQTTINALPAGMEAGVVTYGNTGGAPFPNYRTLKAGTNVTITDAGAQSDLTISAVNNISGVVWGAISGTLSNQTDLQTALNAKLTAASNLSDVSNVTTALNNLLPNQSTHSGEFLTTNGANASWTTNAGGDVVGPSSATDNAVARFDGATGKLIQNSIATISDIGFIVGTGLGTPTTAGSTFTLRAYDVDGTSYTTMVTLTANNTPTMDLSTAVTQGGAVIYRVGGTDVAPGDGGTGVSNNALSTWTINGSFPTTITLAGTTAITVPTSGTMATVNGAENLTNKTITSATITGGAINNAVIGGTTPATGTFTTVSASSFTPLSATAPPDGMYLQAASTTGIASNNQPVVTFNKVNSTPSNYFAFTAAASGGTPGITTAGTDSAVSGNLYTKSTGVWNIGTNTNVTELLVGQTPSGANWVQIQGGVAGNPALVNVIAGGASTAIDLALAPKGSTGVVRFNNVGSFTANGTVATSVTSLGPTGSRTTIQKWLAIKDNGGNPFWIPLY